ncbi:MBL fold metallo-hydrolase [Paenibacillus methanolicus]|uniref:Phosphoribosyl 1,2-cyclic phosphate phosphodiesterase n=1 Tax=Paenibacillus methanolicus TaxID=582686 RepID=A0A5S5CN80_9BACL|nr:MBL fold metallo-hydrolase [Paenibacillus methanolicus]TYP79818.1 phosphoribosyl 1,2-cyclic phosphate phosphodiesterase [Paenibacillus methanolicus]
MKIHFLGTAAAEGYPNAFCRCEACAKARSLGGRNVRTRSSVIIDDVMKVDYSPDSHMQALRDRVDLGAVEHLLFTHTHYDHFNPEDLFSRIEGFAHGIDAPLAIYGNDAVIGRSRAALGPYAGDRFRFRLARPFETFEAGDARVTPLLADHDRYETCLLYDIEKGGRRMFYGNDTGWLPETTWAWLDGRQVDLAILDCTHGYTGNDRNPNHMGIETILEVKRRMEDSGAMAKDGQIFVTHFTHNSGLLHEEFVRIFEPAGIQVAYDGLVVQI